VPAGWLTVSAYGATEMPYVGRPSFSSASSKWNEALLDALKVAATTAPKIWPPLPPTLTRWFGAYSEK